MYSCWFKHVQLLVRMYSFWLKMCTAERLNSDLTICQTSRRSSWWTFSLERDAAACKFIWAQLENGLEKEMGKYLFFGAPNTSLHTQLGKNCARMLAYSAMPRAYSLPASRSPRINANQTSIHIHTYLPCCLKRRIARLYLCYPFRFLLCSPALLSPPLNDNKPNDKRNKQTYFRD